MKTWLGLLSGFILGTAAAQAATLKVGDRAPDFRAASSAGTTVHLGEQIGRAPIVLYFYPKDDTPGCTREACGLRDDWAAFRTLKAMVYGISYDSVKSHRQFIQKYNLPFELLSDGDHTVAKAYGADGLLFAKRMTFVIDQNGKIVYINPSVSPAQHSAELQQVLARLQ